MTYQDLLSATLPTGLREEEPAPLPDEMEIQSLWFSGLFGHEFTDSEGREIRLRDPGEWNRGDGPDFLHASVEIDGQTRHGPIEIDLEAENWERHGHRDNPAFEKVILHVVLCDPPGTFFTRNRQNQLIPRLLISPTSLREALGKPRLSQTLARPGTCQRPLAELSPADLDALLHQAAWHRLRLKARRHRRIVRLRGKDQTLWESLAESLGYARNSLPMRLLAQRLPICGLSARPSADIEALLYGTAGYLSADLHEKAPPDSRQWLEKLWQRWWKFRPEFELAPTRRIPWSLRGTRPANHPQRRLAVLALAASHWPAFARACRKAPPFGELRSWADTLAHPFWSHHHTLGSQALPKKLALFGESRLKAFIINQLYPLHLDHDPAHWPAFAKLRADAPNQKIRRVCERLFGDPARAGSHRKFLWQEQALLQIYQDFCLAESGDCTDCPFPTQLRNFKAPLE
ncbi:MAG: DUF2851 family protein [Verrucomicrobiales bacterium]